MKRDKHELRLFAAIAAAVDGELDDAPDAYPGNMVHVSLGHGSSSEPCFSFKRRKQTCVVLSESEFYADNLSEALRLAQLWLKRCSDAIEEAAHAARENGE